MARIINPSEYIRSQVAVDPSYMVTSRLRRFENQSEAAGTRKGDGWRRNGQDEMLLEVVTRLGVITLSQACRYVYSKAYETVRKRLGKMVDAGLLKRMDTMLWAGSIFYPTRAGRRAVLGDNSPLIVMEPPAESTMLHRLLVTEEALKLLAAGKTIITEREARLFEMGETPDKIEDRNIFLASMGVRRSINNSPGAVPTPQGTRYGTVERFLLLPTPAAESDYRIPDLFEVTETGELRVVEVELTPKRPVRMRGILAGYREACRGHNLEPKASMRSLKEVGPLYRQFAGVRWVGTESVIDMIRGSENGVDPITGKENPGLVRPLWDGSINTHLFYRDQSSWAMEKRGWPVSVELIDLAHDSGLEYALHQLIFPVKYRSTLREWRRWRKIWKQDVLGDPDPIPFPQWLRLPGQMKNMNYHQFEK